MKFKVETVLEELLPWDLEIEHDGHAWPTRRPSVATLLKLAEPRALTEAQAAALTAEIFQSPPPPLALWPREAANAAVAAYLAYFAELAEKNSRTIAARARAAIGRQLAEARPL